MECYNNLFIEMSTSQGLRCVPSFQAIADQQDGTLSAAHLNGIGRSAEHAKAGPHGLQISCSSLLELSEVDVVAANWALINGFVEETTQTDYRQVFTFLRGVFVRKARVTQLLTTFAAMRYVSKQT
jgi:hypothetical protein